MVAFFYHTQLLVVIFRACKTSAEVIVSAISKNSSTGAFYVVIEFNAFQA